MTKTKTNFNKTLLLILLLPITILAVKTIVDLRKSAFFKPANITVDLSTTFGNLSQTLWQNIAQGGEEASDMIRPIISQTRALQLQLIRIDHIFDHFDVYRPDGNHNFTELDKIVNSILISGATPMFSISYTPTSLSSNGQVTGQPSNWQQWQSLVSALAKRYSLEKNISDIYYEIWNEPDLFGGWHYGKDPNYLTLYSQTAQAIKNSLPSKNYKIGGPATTNFYLNWIEALFKHCSSLNLPLDFISWHQYDLNIDKYNQNIENLNKILTKYPQFFNVERIITEFGHNSEADTWYDNKNSGVHLLSTVTQLSGKIHRLFPFELVDGPTNRSSSSSGWGIITHPQSGASLKPRYHAFTFLNQLKGLRLNTIGDGSLVTSLSTQNGSTTQVLLVNYDPRNSHSETFPLTFQAIANQPYILKTTVYMGATNQKIINPPTTTYTETIYMEPNTAILLELTPQ